MYKKWFYQVVKDRVPETGFLGTKIQPKNGLKASLTMFFGMLVFEIFHNENIKKILLKINFSILENKISV